MARKPSTSDKFFLPFQARWIKDQADIKLIEKSRQIGLSYSTAYSAVRRAAEAGARHDVWVSSRDDAQAKLFILDCQGWARILDLAAKDLGEVVISDEKATASVLEFASGRRIYSLSSNPNALAGKRGHVILDEFALHKDQRLLYRIAKPVTQWGGQLEIISTHRGVDSVFNQLIRDIVEKGNPMGWSHHKVTIQDAVAAGLVEKINAKKGSAMTREEFLAKVRAECIDEEQWLQEYCCVPADEGSAFITYEMIAAAEAPLLEGPVAGSWYVGVDIGRTQDLTVIWVLEEVGGVFFTRFYVELKKTPFRIQEETLYPILANPAVRRVCIDQTGIGRQFAERAQERFGAYRVEGVTFTGPVKEELAYPVRGALEDRRLKVPRRPEIMADLRAVQKETTAAGNVRFVAERSSNGHADRFWALALALHAGKSRGNPGTFGRFRSSVYSRTLAARRDRRVIA